MRTNSVKSALAAGRVPLGTMVTEFDTSGIAPLAAGAGAEFLFIDQEHTGWTTDTIRRLVVGARAAGVTPIVRPPTLAYSPCAQLLDLGAMGIIAPMIGTAQQAADLVSFCRYPPVGRRGATMLAPHDDYLPGDPREKTARANAEIWTVALIETPEGVANIEEIVAVDGLDALWVGHLDLTSFMGCLADFENPEFRAALDRVLAAAAAAGKPVGIVVGSPQEAKQRLDQGFSVLAYGTDSSLYQQGLRAGIEGVTALLEGNR
jgi:2-keto-3-deoxy-L-rhamnonate aldolase RhmA